VSTLILERLFSITTDEVVKGLASVPALKDHLYRVEKDEILKGLNYDSFAYKEISQYPGFLVARLSAKDVQAAETEARVLLGAAAEPIQLPSGWPATYPFELTYPHLLKYLKQLAQQLPTATIYYKLTNHSSAQVEDVEAWFFDYRTGARYNDYGFSETTDQGQWLGGFYVWGANPTHSHKLINSYQESTQGRPFDTPLMRIAGAYHLIFEWNSHIDWEKRRIRA
jgi:hypothetical protein